MDLVAYAKTYNDKLREYIEKYYGPIPRCRGFELMKVRKEPYIEDTDFVKYHNQFIDKDVVYIHTRCGDCGMGYDDEESNYIYCGAKDWEEEHKDLFIGHYTDEFDTTYCNHYFKAVINDEYKELLKELEEEEN